MSDNDQDVFRCFRKDGVIAVRGISVIACQRAVRCVRQVHAICNDCAAGRRLQDDSETAAANSLCAVCLALRDVRDVANRNFDSFVTFCYDGEANRVTLFRDAVASGRRFVRWFHDLLRCRIGHDASACDCFLELGAGEERCRRYVFICVKWYVVAISANGYAHANAFRLGYDSGRQLLINNQDRRALGHCLLHVATGTCRHGAWW